VPCSRPRTRRSSTPSFPSQESRFGRRTEWRWWRRRVHGHGRAERSEGNRGVATLRRRRVRGRERGVSAASAKGAFQTSTPKSRRRVRGRERGVSAASAKGAFQTSTPKSRRRVRGRERGASADSAKGAAQTSSPKRRKAQPASWLDLSDGHRYRAILGVSPSKYATSLGCHTFVTNRMTSSHRVNSTSEYRPKKPASYLIRCVRLELFV
jgi:hypothetical protein